MNKLIGILIVITLFSHISLAQFPNTAAQDSIRKITKIDHDNMLAQLKITNLRQGANGNDPKAPNAARNY
jgi:4-hydroxy-L-threonine phosphate dehydrogenase PdxA